MKTRWHDFKKLLGLAVSLSLLSAGVNPAGAAASGRDLAQTGPGYISGTVYEQGGTTPLEDIYVAVSGQNYFASTCTDASGQYAFSGLPLDVDFKVQAAPQWGKCTAWHDYVKEFWPEAVDADSARVVTPNRTDIDFTLAPGGVISGQTFLADGSTPLPHIAVTFRDEYGDYAEPICSDANGQYTFHGLPLDLPLRAAAYSYRDGWCDSGGDYLDEFWPNVPNLASATPMTVTAASPSLSGINFSLETAGSISGTVYQEDGATRIPNAFMTLLAKDRYWGWIYMDDLGNYTIHNVPFGVPVYVRASGGGRSDELWPNSPNLAGASKLTVDAGTPHRNGIDFTLAPVSVSPDPYMRAWHMADSIEAVDWPEGTHLTLEIEDMTTEDPSPDYTVEMDFTDSSRSFDLSGQFDIQPGMIVVLSGASLIKAVVVNDVAITQVDQVEDTISGTTPPNSWMWMFFEQSCCRSTVADATGHWSIDYAVPGPAGEPVADIGQGSEGAVHVPSGDGSTSVYWFIPNPEIDVWYQDGLIEAFGWPAGTHLTLSIEDTTTPLSPDYSAETDVTQTVPWDPTAPYATFQVPLDTFPITPGMEVSVSGDSLTSAIVVDSLTVTDIDQDLETITGTTGPDNWLWIFFDQSCAPTCRSTVADGSGIWTMNYSIAGPEGQPAANIGPESTGGVHVPSGDGRTSVIWAVPPAPEVVSSAPTGGNPASAGSVTFTVTFTESVTGVDAGDFVLTATGLTGSSITNVAGSGSLYTVTANTGSVGASNGTLRLDVVDNDSIRDDFNSPLGGSGAGNGSFQGEQSFTIAARVSRPTLLSPLQNHITTDSTPSFSWSEVTDASQYDIQFGTNSTFNPEISSDTVPGQAYTVGSALDDGKYYWRVRARNDLDEPGDWSTPRYFVIDTTPPVAPDAKFPLNGATVRSLPMFRWTAVSGAVMYEFEIDDNPDFLTPLFSTEQRIPHRRVPGGLRGVYYWRVRARDTAGNWSAWAQFTVTILPRR